MKKIILDFETTNVNPEKAQPLQFAYILKDTITGKEVRYSYNVKFQKYFENCSKSEQSALIFNNIKDNIDLDAHNLKSKTGFDVITLFLKHIKAFGTFDVIEGYNIKNYDLIILDDFFLKYYGKKFSDLFQFKLNDVYLRALALAKSELLVLPNNLISIYAKNFNNSLAYRTYLINISERTMQEKQGLLKLENLHKLIFKESGLKFHRAIDDCIATDQVGNYLYRLELKNPRFLNDFQKQVCKSCNKVIQDSDSPLELPNNLTLCGDVRCLRQHLIKLHTINGTLDKVPEKHIKLYGMKKGVAAND